MVQMLPARGGLASRLGAAIGSGLGQGLAQSVPQEIERGRLTQGLQQLSQQEGLTPFQRFAQLSSIPGITPQMIQSGSELLKQQGMRESAMRRGGRGGEQSGKEFSQGIQNIQGVPFGGDRFQGRNPQGQSTAREHETINQPGQPQIENANPLRESALPIAPWTPQRMEQEVSRVLENYGDITLPEAIAQAEKNEARYLAQPAAERERDQYREGIRNKAHTEFDRQLQAKLQKGGTDVFKDITGDHIERAKRLVERDLASHPNATDQTLNDIINTRTNQLRELATTKTQLNELANRDFADKINPIKKEQNFKKLKSYANIFKNSGNSEEYFNILKSQFNMSPFGAAEIAFPLNQNLEKYTNNIKPSTFKDWREKSRKYAIDIQDKLTPNDSLLAIAAAIRQKDPNFSQSDFFDQLEKDRKNVTLNGRMANELGTRESDIFPDWGDLAIFPFFGR